MLRRHTALTAIAFTFGESERERKPTTDGIVAIRAAVTEVVVLMLFALGEEFATRAAAFSRDPPL